MVASHTQPLRVKRANPATPSCSARLLIVIPFSRLAAAQSPDQDGQLALERDFLNLINDCNTATDGTMKVPSEYLEVVISM